MKKKESRSRGLPPRPPKPCTRHKARPKAYVHRAAERDRASTVSIDIECQKCGALATVRVPYDEIEWDEF